MSQSNQNSAVAFADITDSTDLYECYGDAAAQRAITACLKLMSDNVRSHGGHVVRTVGDEIMCQFAELDAAVNSLVDLNKVLASELFNDDIRLKIKSGLHYGPVIEEQGDLYGDAVNVAARMRSLAKAEQILITQGVAERLSGDLGQHIRKIDKTSIKGKQDPIDVFEVLWEKDDITRIMSSTIISDMLATLKLTLTIGDQKIELAPDAPIFILGRASQCDLVINSPGASRIHARIEYRRGKFMLMDQSINGTFIRTADGKEVFIKREELPLWDKGIISLGSAISDNSPHILNYECE